MPRGDGTGPMGMGPMTGRAAGFCAGYNVPGYMNQAAGRGLGMRTGCGRGLGMGGGRGFRNRFSAPEFQQPTAMAKDQELAALKRQAEYFENTLKAVRGNIAKLES